MDAAPPAAAAGAGEPAVDGAGEADEPAAVALGAGAALPCVEALPLAAGAAGALADLSSFGAEALPLAEAAADADAAGAEAFVFVPLAPCATAADTSSNEASVARTAFRSLITGPSFE